MSISRTTSVGRAWGRAAARKGHPKKNPSDPYLTSWKAVWGAADGTEGMIVWIIEVRKSFVGTACVAERCGRRREPDVALAALVGLGLVANRASGRVAAIASNASMVVAILITAAPP